MKLRKSPPKVIQILTQTWDVEGNRQENYPGGPLHEQKEFQKNKNREKEWREWSKKCLKEFCPNMKDRHVQIKRALRGVPGWLSLWNMGLLILGFKPHIECRDTLKIKSLIK